MTSSAVPARPRGAESRCSQLDGLRALLFACIFVAHHLVDRVEFLSYSLSAFFVMSGFLITRVLWLCQADSAAGRLRTFYLRRAIRILPAYLLVVGLLMIFDPLQHPESYLLFFLNIKLFLLSLHQESQEFIRWWYEWNTQDLHLWSVSVEEQFYLVFPLVFFYLPTRHMSKAFVAAIGVSVLSRIYFRHYLPTSFYGHLLTGSLEYFAWGAYFAWRELHGTMPRLPAWQSIYLPVAAIVVIVSIEFHFGLDGYFHQSTTHFVSLIAPLIALVIWGLWTAEPDLPLVRLLRARPLVYLGEVSYPMYLTHMTWIVVSERQLQPYLAPLVSTPTEAVLLRIAVSGVLTCISGALIWHLVEQPVFRLKRYVPLRPQRPLTSAGPSDGVTASA